jgi:hypothetical protein
MLRLYVPKDYMLKIKGELIFRAFLINNARAHIHTPCLSNNDIRCHLERVNISELYINLGRVGYMLLSTDAILKQ